MSASWVKDVELQNIDCFTKISIKSVTLSMARPVSKNTIRIMVRLLHSLRGITKEEMEDMGYVIRSET